MARQLPGDLDDLSTDPFDVAQAAAAILADLTGVVRHEIALVPGSGWGGAADLLGEQVAEIAATGLPGCSVRGPTCTRAGRRVGWCTACAPPQPPEHASSC